MLDRRRLLMTAQGGGVPPGGGIVMDGLVFRLNGQNQGGQRGLWIDEIGGEVLTLFNCVEQQNGVLFSRHKRSVAKGRIVSGEDIFIRDGTLQFCYSNNTGREFAIFAAGLWNIGSYGKETITCSNKAMPRFLTYAFDIINTPRATVSTTNSTFLANRVQIPANGAEQWTVRSNYMFIGSYRAEESSAMLDAIVHEIRFYNRKLTREEELQNQQYDIDTYFGGVLP